MTAQGCKSWRSDLSAWIDGELDAGRAAAVEQHVQSCADCHEIVEELRAVSNLLRKLPRVSAPVLQSPQAAQRRSALKPPAVTLYRVATRVIPIAAVVALAFLAGRFWDTFDFGSRVPTQSPDAAPVAADDAFRSITKSPGAPPDLPSELPVLAQNYKPSPEVALGRSPMQLREQEPVREAGSLDALAQPVLAVFCRPATWEQYEQVTSLVNQRAVQNSQLAPMSASTEYHLRRSARSEPQVASLDLGPEEAGELLRTLASETPAGVAFEIAAGPSQMQVVQQLASGLQIEMGVPLAFHESSERATGYDPGVKPEDAPPIVSDLRLSAAQGERDVESHKDRHERAGSAPTAPPIAHSSGRQGFASPPPAVQKESAPSRTARSPESRQRGGHPARETSSPPEFRDEAEYESGKTQTATTTRNAIATPGDAARDADAARLGVANPQARVTVVPGQPHDAEADEKKDAAQKPSARVRVEITILPPE